jgi:Xaa-Pro aminopeptidase
VVERTFAWLGRNRRLAKDFKQTIASATAWLFIASIQLFVRHATFQRVASVRDRLRARPGVHAVVVAPGSDLRYLSGYDALALERPTLLVLAADGPPAIVAPRLEQARVEHEVLLAGLVVHTYGEHDDAFALAGRALAAPEGALVALGDQMWTAFALALQRVLPGRHWSRASELIAPLRAVKDADELARLAIVGRAIDAVHRRVPDVLRPGRSEREVATDLAAMIREGHDEVSFVIVAAGPNSASPHHEPGDRVIQPGDIVVVDIGGTLDGYCSDMTRTYAVGHVPEGFAAVRPGATAGEVDAAAREVLAAAGLGEAFVHRTGHGIGLETHEEPWILGGSDVPLVPGMAFSVEPGFYLDGRYGARIEDIVTVTAGGVESLNVVDRGLVVV